MSDAPAVCSCPTCGLGSSYKIHSDSLQALNASGCQNCMSDAGPAWDGQVHGGSNCLWAMYTAESGIKLTGKKLHQTPPVVSLVGTPPCRWELIIKCLTEEEQMQVVWHGKKDKGYTPAGSYSRESGCSEEPDPLVLLNLLKIGYIGGTSNTNAAAEAYKELIDGYFLKGYMLKISTPPIAQGTSVTWSITRQGTPVGTYHEDGAWTSYFDSLGQIPNTPTIYWRSDVGGSLTDTYIVSATYRPPGATQDRTITRALCGRALTPEEPAHRNYFNEDADMLQRAMIQMLYLDKGRLSTFRVGQYDKGSQNGWYVSNVPGRTITNWSSIADEVWNFHKFTLDSQNPSYALVLPIVEGIWAQFSRILAAQFPDRIDSTHANYDVWIDAAVDMAELVVPENFGATPAALLKAQVQRESNGIHCYNLSVPLASISVQIGENRTGVGANEHVFTDGGLGFGKVQPYNAGDTWNLYHPVENLYRVAEIDLANITGTNENDTPGQKVWRALFKYNNGQYRYNKTIQELREDQDDAIRRSAQYADDIFGILGIQLP